ncbi:hypothetical protein K438DRAFT_1973939 [Mycena galopus ATCC 62051]|nr:hypothetical protein K438DRAFT_1973939 [Mycena galopus ATCC 62051]
MKMLMNSDLVSDQILDSYFKLFTLDIANQTATDPSALPFVFTDSILGEHFIKAKRNPAGMSPPEKSNPRLGNRTHWFENLNIFDKDHLIMPIFWISIVGDTRFKAIYGRMWEMLDWEHRQQYGISIPDVWVLWSEQAVVKVPQQGPTVDCAIYMTAFAEPLANLKNANYPTSMEYNSTSAAQGHIKIANRLNMVIRSCNLNYQALGIRTPSVMSTEPEHKPSDEVVQQRRMLLIPSNSLGCIVFFASPVNPRIFLPASGIAIVQDGILMEWKCAPFFMAEDQKPKGEFVCSQENWKTAASVTLEINQLVPVMWPASRTTFTNRRFPTYIFSSDRSLAAALEAHADQVICYLKGEEPESALFSKMRGDFSTLLANNPKISPSLYEMALFPRLHFIRESSHEAMVYDLVSKIDSTFRTFSTTSPVTHEEQQLLNVGEGVGSSSLWVTYIQHFWPHVDPSVVYEAMKEGKVDWPETESERMWHEYIRVCPSASNLASVLQIVVPHLPSVAPILTL